jgi:hypothetical protein
MREGQMMSTDTRQDVSDISVEQIQVRKVTHWQPTFTASDPGENGTYTFQLILDQGAEEAILRVAADDADNLFDWLIASSDVYFDLSRRVLMFGTRPVGS